MQHATPRRRFLAGCLALGLGTLVPAGWANAAGRPYRGLVILAEFPDIPLPVDRAAVAERFLRLDRYVREMSYGAASLDVELSGWHMMPAPVRHYAISPVNLLVDKSRVVRLIQDAIDRADAPNDFSRYDYVVVFLGARFHDYGMVGLCGYPGMLGWQQEIAFRTRSGQTVPNGVAIFTTTAHLGTLFHDSAHVWGGVRDGKRNVPCLYDHDLQAEHPTIATGWPKALINMGYWDPMSCHSYKRHLPPPGISAWTRIRLGWLPEAKVRLVQPGQTGELLLSPLEEADGEILAIRLPLSSERYLLIENRQPIGSFDPHLPGHGVLIMVADDAIPECRHGRAPVRLIDAHPERRHLEGAAFDINGRDNHVDTANGIDIRLLEKVGMSYRIRVRRR